MESNRTERQSPLHVSLALSHAGDLLSEEYYCVFKDPVGEACYLITLCILVQPLPDSLDSSSYRSENDFRSRVVVQIMDMSARLRDWVDCRSVLRQFYCWDSCEPQWKTCLDKART